MIMAKEKKMVKKDDIKVTTSQKTAIDLAEMINAKFKTEIAVAEGGAPKKVEAISTGSMLLDVALGVGGLPRGRVIEIFGPEASGKTTLTLHLAAEAQQRGLQVVFIDAEHALDPQYAQRIGVKMNELLIVQPDYGEQAFDVADTLIESGQVGLIIIDSVAALTPQAELEGTMEDHGMGQHARLMSKGLRRITAKAAKNNVQIVFINQLRMKIGVMFGSPETTTGGEALKFYASTRLRVSRTKSQVTGADHEKVGIMKVKIQKNKVAVPFKECEIPVIYGEGIDQIGETYAFAKEVGIFKTTGGSHYYKGIGKFTTLAGDEIQNDENDKTNRFATKGSDALEELKKNDKFYQLVRKQVKEALQKIVSGEMIIAEEETKAIEA